MRRRVGLVVGSVVVLSLMTAGVALGGSPPAQRLPSALLVYPLVAVDGSHDTRVEVLNLSSREQRLSCFYIDGNFCGQIGFFITLTANQPMSWLASQGTFNAKTFSAVPPFRGTGELKCAVLPSQPEVDSHNAIQGRAIVFGSDGETLGYGAVGFQRLSDGEFSGVAELDGATYAQCPDEMHFAFLGSDENPNTMDESEVVLTPCSEDLENLIPTSTTVQFLVVNEFEQFLSASVNVSCYKRSRLSEISHIFARATLGSDTGHAIVRGVQTPVLAMLIDRFVDNRFPANVNAAAANEPALRGGRPATVRFP